jgi:hypothetical protein
MGIILTIMGTTKQDQMVDTIVMVKKILTLVIGFQLTPMILKLNMPENMMHSVMQVHL